MKYTIKWITEHMGITRDMIREYEKQGLLDKKQYENPENKYREYNEDDLKRLWGIKFFIELGFKIKELKSFFENRNTDPEIEFEKLLLKKREELSSLKQTVRLLDTIVATGQLPTLNKTGEMTITDFMDTVLSDWSLPEIIEDFSYWDFVKLSQTPPKKITNQLIESDNYLAILEFTLENLPQMLESKDSFETIKQTSYVDLIVELGGDYKSDIIQGVVKLYYKSVKTQYQTQQNNITPKLFAKVIAPTYMEGKFKELDIPKRSDSDRIFIANAIAYFGGFDTYNSMIDYFENNS